MWSQLCLQYYTGKWAMHFKKCFMEMKISLFKILKLKLVLKSNQLKYIKHQKKSSNKWSDHNKCIQVVIQKWSVCTYVFWNIDNFICNYMFLARYQIPDSYRYLALIFGSSILFHWYTYWFFVPLLYYFNCYNIHISWINYASLKNNKINE